jgi:hypothetical protein
MAVFVFVTRAQNDVSFYRMDMAVVFTDSTRTYRFDTASVLWGSIGDTLLFDLEEERHFYPIKDNNFTREQRDNIHRLYAWICTRRDNRERHYLLQDENNKIYHIHFAINADTAALLIWITNVGDGFPNYFLARLNK